MLAINDEVDVSAREMERLARLATLPDSGVLSAARLRFSRALRRHLQYIDGVVMPHLRGNRNPVIADKVDAFRSLLNRYHEAAAHHVAQWHSTAVTTDWSGYRRSVVDMLARLRARIDVEKRDIHPLLARRDPPLR